jgi:hypothetical protein
MAVGTQMRRPTQPQYAQVPYVQKCIKVLKVLMVRGRRLGEVLGGGGVGAGALGCAATYEQVALGGLWMRLQKS